MLDVCAELGVLTKAQTESEGRWRKTVCLQTEPRWLRKDYGQLPLLASVLGAESVAHLRSHVDPPLQLTEQEPVHVT